MSSNLPVIAADDEAYWSGIRAQYAVSPEFINLENGYFGVQARPVFEAFQRYQAQVNAETSYFLRVRYAPLFVEVMQALKEFCGADDGELVLTRNLIEGMNILLQGYPLQAGDEVILASHDYDIVIDTLQMLEHKKNIRLVQLRLPFDPVNDEEIVQQYEQAITAKTRLILVTHIVHRTGQIMPVARITAMARRHGVEVMVDAAHSFAQLDYRMPDLRADFVAVNLHKWLGAPLGVGMLYIRKHRVAEIAPLFGNTKFAEDEIFKFSQVGTVPPANILAVLDALRFHQQIGSRNKEARLRYLTQYWLGQVRGLPGVRIMVPTAPERSCAIAGFCIDGRSGAYVVDKLMQEHKIFTVTRELDGHQIVRVTPHLYTSLEDLDCLIAAIRQLAGS
ncbi:aminotransferase class V-fold PLP-dependent enzyme [Undibacterium sp. TS12]|uniref:aminotransferase class V-fold PLP-dependent enzyme n=1 Tax=Undibacterium sp. TS12 TaxID=2908202 RepID=UPI001F4C5C99|nr:aminotransferase class V-fold PLP-dependent enzyme [Undibacterium sp. TS12]MCH8621843.1 aminotransferase class V-fold PLP-dependent enzyme [Undibacterium sp. TS12]